MGSHHRSFIIDDSLAALLDGLPSFLLFEPSLDGPSRRARRQPRRAGFIQALEPLNETRKRRVAILMLRARISGRDANARRYMA